MHFNDADPRVTAALAARTAGQPRGRVRITTEDCNTVVESVREFLFPPGTLSTTLGLAVIDPLGFQMSFDAIRRLTTDVRLDLLIVFMTSYIRRFRTVPSLQPTLDRFFGTEDWRSLHTNGTYEEILNLYKQQLAQLGYHYITDSQRMTNSNDSTIYHLVFTSRHPLGKDFFDKVSRRTYSGQLKLNLL